MGGTFDCRGDYNRGVSLVGSREGAIFCNKKARLSLAFYLAFDAGVGAFNPIVLRWRVDFAYYSSWGFQRDVFL
jgi:hypothetical protein